MVPKTVSFGSFSIDIGDCAPVGCMIGCLTDRRPYEMCPTAVCSRQQESRKDHGLRRLAPGLSSLNVAGMCPPRFGPVIS